MCTMVSSHLYPQKFLTEGESPHSKRGCLRTPSGCSVGGQPAALCVYLSSQPWRSFEALSRGNRGVSASVLELLDLSSSRPAHGSGSLGDLLLCHLHTRKPGFHKKSFPHSRMLIRKEIQCLTVSGHNWWGCFKVSVDLSAHFSASTTRMTVIVTCVYSLACSTL